MYFKDLLYSSFEETESGDSEEDSPVSGIECTMVGKKLLREKVPEWMISA